MRSLIALAVGLLIALSIYYLYFRKAAPTGTGGPPLSAVTIAGVQNDLLAIARAEGTYFAEHGAYAASLGELVSSGALTMTRTSRDGYTYSVETTAEGFTATARYEGPDAASFPTLVIDQGMQVRRSD